MAPPIVLTIAGFDPSSGAGITADIKTIGAHHCYGVACITSMTVQSTRGVRRVQAMPPALVRDTLQELASDMTFAAVKIGMLDSREIAEEVADFLEENKPAHVVLDPVMRSSSGMNLIDRLSIGTLKERLIPLATVITPNIDEAGTLINRPVRTAYEMKSAAEALHALGARAVIITGGHLDPPNDLVSADGEVSELPGDKINSPHTHGTGCAFSTSLACSLANDRTITIRQAAILAKAYVTEAIRKAYPVGKGAGPVNHFWNK